MVRGLGPEEREHRQPNPRPTILPYPPGWANPRNPSCPSADTPTMRIPLLAVASLLALAACGSTPTSTPATGTTATPPPPPAVTSASSTSAAVLAWGGDGSSSGVYIKIGTPTTSPDPVIGVNGKPDPAFRFVMLPVTAGNKTSGLARVSFFPRVGAKEAPAMAGDVPEALPGETAEFQQKVQVPVDASELIVEVYATVDGKPATNRLHFKGPIG